MVIDKKEHQDILLALIDSASFKGEFLEQAYALKKAIESAEIIEQG